MDIPSPSCPHGYTKADLDNILGDRYPAFFKWMGGQTVMLCQGTQYHHNRVHDENCMTSSQNDPAHSEDTPYNWRCGYTGTGYSEPTACAGDPHGIVVYRWDLETFLAGKDPLD